MDVLGGRDEPKLIESRFEICLWSCHELRASLVKAVGTRLAQFTRLSQSSIDDG